MPLPLLAWVVPTAVAGALIARARKPKVSPFLIKPIRASLPREGAKASFNYHRTPTHWHRGVDLGAAKGTPILPAAPGVVVHAITQPGTPGFRGYGRVVVIQHPNGLYTLYSHMDTVRVRAGDSVDLSRVIGTVGDSCDIDGNPNNKCEGPHLHFELSANAYPQDSEAPRLDPTKYLLAA